MFAPLNNDGNKGWVFRVACPGNSRSFSHERQMLLLKYAPINRNLGFDKVCRERHVNIAYNNEKTIFEINSGKMVRYPLKPYVGFFPVALEWEVQAAFFEINNIIPHWKNCNYTWGSLNETTGKWSGAVGMIQRDEVDYAIWGFVGTYARSKVAAFSPGIDYVPNHWLTRYPQPFSPTWNLLGLFTKEHKYQLQLKRVSILSNN